MKIDSLGKYVKIQTGKLDANASSIDGQYPFFTCSKDPLKINSYTYDTKCVLVAGNGDLNVKYYEGKFDAYQRTYIIESKDETILKTRYLYYFLSKYVETLRELSIGGVIKYIKLNNLTDSKIPIPSVEKQSEIINTLDLSDAIHQKRKQAINLLDEYVKSLFLEMFGDPIINEKNWKRIKFSELLVKIESGRSPVCLNRPATTDEWGVLKLGAITQCIYKPYENKALPEKERPNKSIEVKQGDVLFSRKNTYELVAACAYVWSTPSKLMLPDLIFRFVIKDDKKLDSIYLQSLLSNLSKRKSIQQLAGGAAGSMPNISKSKLLNQFIELPPIEEQRKYAEIVTQVEKLKQKMLSQSLELENQFQSVMHQSFTVS